VVLFLGGFVSLLACAAGLFLGLEVDSKAAGQRETQVGDFVTELELESGMGSFLCSRPYTSKQFSASILKTAAYSSLASWLLWFLVFIACLFTLWMLKLKPDYYLPKDVGILFIPMTILGPWIAMANLGTIGLSGRGASILFTLVTSSVGYCVALGVIRQFADVMVVMHIHAVCTTVAALLAVAATGWAFAVAYRRKHVSIVNLGSIAGVGCGLMVAALVFRPASATFIYYPLAVIFATLVVAPFACTPLAIAWNRHR
ncbi:MAG: hypothetical protein SFV81_29560, partial [Pirellulaceae bacterium]|nr:hypothetical protein [Pirellulaceae bacterium]